MKEEDYLLERICYFKKMYEASVEPYLKRLAYLKSIERTSITIELKDDEPYWDARLKEILSVEEPEHDGMICGDQLNALAGYERFEEKK